MKTSRQKQQQKNAPLATVLAHYDPELSFYCGADLKNESYTFILCAYKLHEIHNKWEIMLMSVCPEASVGLFFGKAKAA